VSAPACRLVDVAYAYPDGTAALAGVTFDIAPGEKIAVIGPNGAGKSTLLLHLNGVLLAAKGRVEIDGMEVCRKNLGEIRRRVGVVFQNPDDQLFCPTVREDVAFGPRNMGLADGEVQGRVRSALEVVGMTGFENRSAHHLSYGQKKKVAIATVLSMRPSLWAFDEPTANLDPASLRAVEAFIRAQEDTVVVVTQDLAFAARTRGRIVALEEGRVALDGPLDGILSRPAELERLGIDFSRQCYLCEKIRGAV